MTSSKSFRHSILPSSLSLSLRFDSKQKPVPSSPPRKAPRSKSVTHLHGLANQYRQEEERPDVPPVPSVTGGAARKRAESQRSVSPDERYQNGGQASPNRLLSRRARTWGVRVSSLIPTLTHQSSDPQLGSLHRRTSSEMMPPPPVPESSPPPPPAPAYSLPESPSTSSELGGDYTTASSDTLTLDSSSFSCPQDSPPIPVQDGFDHPVPPALGLAPIPEPDAAPSLNALDFGWSLQTSLIEEHVAPPKREKLQKANPDLRPRSSSLRPRTDSLPPVMVPKTRQTAPVEPRGRSVSVQALSVDPNRGSLAAPSPITPQAVSPNHSQSPHTEKRRRSWISGGRSRSNSIETSNPINVPAWVMSDGSNAEYNTSYLQNGDRVPELWNENGTVLVFLYPKGSGRGPSFKVPEFTVSSSYIFNELIKAELESTTARSRARSFGGRASLSVEDATRMMTPPISPSVDYSGELCLYVPCAQPSSEDLATPQHGQFSGQGRMVAVRNLFAFLTGQPLVGTKSCPSTFEAFLKISELLEEFCFASIDGQTFGSAVDLSFGFYCDQLGLQDCRNSREHTVEALVLGERMRYKELYNEAFAHATGKYSAILDLHLPLFNQVSRLTRERLERAHLELVNRQHGVNQALEQFEFPSLFAGLANSTSSPELRLVRFKAWKNAFQKMRHFVLNYYKASFGSWPPKASNKKNPFAESGLNRLVLKVLYSDMCSVYDLLVDRNSLTSRVMDEVPAISSDSDKMTISALRNILSEFDRSKPPVLPPVPFDLPQMPTMTSVLETYNTLSPKDQAKFDKKVKEHELMLVLNKAYNYDTSTVQLPFLDHFRDFELREAKGKTSHDLVDQRMGYWLFLYVVLQSLPTLVVDAPDLKFTEGTEYFLCQPPMGNLPWVDDRHVRKMWYEVAGGGGYVELSADAVNFSIEAIYHRSHCWLAAKAWEKIDESAAAAFDPPMSPLEPPNVLGEALDTVSPLSGHSTPSPPPGSPQLAIRPRTMSPARRQSSLANRSSIVMGLEPVPIEPPPGIYGVHQRSSSIGPNQSSRLSSRNASSGNLVGMHSPRESRSSSPAPAAVSGATFDDILGDSQKKTQKKKSRFF